MWDDSLPDATTGGPGIFCRFPRLEGDAKGRVFEAGDENLGDFRVACGGRAGREETGSSLHEVSEELAELTQNFLLQVRGGKTATF